MKRIKIIDNSQQFKKVNATLLDIALGNMANDIKTISWITVPFKSGDLQKSGQAEKLGFLKHRVIYDKEYAAYQERGERLGGSRQVKTYSTPGTGKGFLLNAGNKVVKDGLNYLKQAANNAKV